jgi:hypothetical protein
VELERVLMTKDDMERQVVELVHQLSSSQASRKQLELMRK